MFKKILPIGFVVLILISMIGGAYATTSQIKLYSDGTDHRFVTTVTTSDRTYTFEDLEVPCTKSKIHYFENNGQPYTVTVNSKAWIDRSFFNYGWSSPTIKSFYNDMSDACEDVTADTCWDTLWNGGHLLLRKCNALN